MGVCQIVKALLQDAFRGWRNKMNVKKSCFHENHSKNSFGLPKWAWKAALGKGFQGLRCNSDNCERYCDLITAMRS